MTYQEWEAEVPEEIRRDPVWRLEAYRLALFLGELAWFDTEVLFRDGRTRSSADQLFRASGGISTNICEGYSRGTGRDRKRFYEYALGSTRETRDWYYKGRHVVGSEVAAHRIQLGSSTIGLLVAMIRTEHRRARVKPKDDTAADE